jgi:hypothetical protein
VPQPTHIDGVEQQPMHGTSFSTRSTTRTPPSGTRSSTSRSSATADVQGRLVAVEDDAADPVEGSTRDAEAVRAGRLGPELRPGRALLPPGRLHAGQRPRRSSTRTRCRSSRSCSGRRPGATTCAAARRADRLLRDPAAGLDAVEFTYYGDGRTSPRARSRRSTTTPTRSAPSSRSRRAEPRA